MSDIEDQDKPDVLDEAEELKKQHEYDKAMHFQEIVQRLKDAQGVIKTTKELIEEEKKLRVEVEQKLTETSSQIKALLVKQNMTTTEKVEDQIKLFLEDIVSGTIKKQDKLRDLKNNHQERCYLNIELERQFYGLRHYIKTTRDELEFSDSELQKLKLLLQKSQNTNLLVKTDIDEKNIQINQLQQQAAQLRGQIQSLSDVKKVINRVTEKDVLPSREKEVFHSREKELFQSREKQSIPARKSASISKKQSQQQEVRSRQDQQRTPAYNDFDPDNNFWYADKQIKLPSIQKKK